MTLLVLLNLAVSLCLFIHIKEFIVRFCLAVNYVMFLQPTVIGLVFGVFHPTHNEWSASYYEKALIFILLYNIVLCVSFSIFRRVFPKVKTDKLVESVNNILECPNGKHIAAITYALLLLAVVAKIKLHSMGAFRHFGEVVASPLLQQYKLVAAFDILTLLLVGLIRAKNILPPRLMNKLYIISIAACLAGAALSGSRFQIINIAVVILITNAHFFRKKLVLGMVALGLIIPPALFIFPIIGYYRVNEYQLDIGVAEAQAFAETVGYKGVMLDVLTTRLNYMENYVYAVGYVDSEGVAGGQTYLNNFLGIVPRLFWPSKPQIENDSQNMGYRLGIVPAHDFSTSIGLRPLGEAYYQLGFYGIIVAFLYGIGLASVQRLIGDSSSTILVAMYINTSMYLAARDGLFAVLPGLILFFLSYIFFIGIIIGIHRILKTTGCRRDIPTEISSTN